MSVAAFYQRVSRCKTFILLWVSLVLDDVIFGKVYVTVVLTSLEWGVLTRLLGLIINHGCWTEGDRANQADFVLK